MFIRDVLFEQLVWRWKMSFRKTNLGIIRGRAEERPAEKRKRVCCGHWQELEVEQCPWSGSCCSPQGVCIPVIWWESWAPGMLSQFSLSSAQSCSCFLLWLAYCMTINISELMLYLLFYYLWWCLWQSRLGSSDLACLVVVTARLAEGESHW